MDGDLIHKILDYASSRSKFAEARYMDLVVNQVGYRNGEFQGLNFGSERGYAVRVVNRSISMAYSDSNDWNRVKESIDRAIEKSNFEGKNRIYEGNPIRDSWKVKARKKLADYSIEDRVAIVRENDTAMESSGAAVRVNSMVDKRINQLYVNSTGSEISGEISRVFYFYLMGVVESGEFEQSTEQFGSSSGFEFIEKLDLRDRIEQDINELHQSAANPLSLRSLTADFTSVFGVSLAVLIMKDSTLELLTS